MMKDGDLDPGSRTDRKPARQLPGGLFHSCFLLTPLAGKVRVAMEGRAVGLCFVGVPENSRRHPRVSLLGEVLGRAEPGYRWRGHRVATASRPVSRLIGLQVPWEGLP